MPAQNWSARLLNAGATALVWVVMIIFWIVTLPLQIAVALWAHVKGKRIRFER